MECFFVVADINLFYPEVLRSLDIAAIAIADEDDLVFGYGLLAGSDAGFVRAFKSDLKEPLIGFVHSCLFAHHHLKEPVAYARLVDFVVLYIRKPVAYNYEVILRAQVIDSLFGLR